MKNKLTIVLVALLIAGNGIIAGLRLDAGIRLADNQARIASLAAGNTAIESDIDALQLENEQAAASLAALQTTATQFSTGTAPAAAKYAAVIAAIEPSVVRINATGPGLRGYSSGVMVSSTGYVLTVLHSVDGAGSVTITLSTGEQFAATIVSRDAAANLALLKITSTRTDFQAAARGSMGGMVTGQSVIAAGFPLSNRLTGPATFTAGVVSSLRTAADFYFIQSDADIAPGSGGGGLFTMDGRLVAVSSLAQADGIYLYIPIDAAATLLNSIPKV